MRQRAKRSGTSAAPARRAALHQHHRDDERADHAGEDDERAPAPRAVLVDERGHAVGGDHGHGHGGDDLVAVGLAEQAEARHVLDQPGQEVPGLAERERQRHGADDEERHRPPAVGARTRGERGQRQRDDHDAEVRVDHAARGRQQADERLARGQRGVERVLEVARRAARGRFVGDGQPGQHDHGEERERGGAGDAEHARLRQGGGAQRGRAAAPRVEQGLAEAHRAVGERREQDVEEPRRRPGGAGEPDGAGERGALSPPARLRGAGHGAVHGDPDERRPHHGPGQRRRLVDDHRHRHDEGRAAEPRRRHRQPARAQEGVEHEPTDHVVQERLHLDGPAGHAAGHGADAHERPGHRVVEARVRIAVERVAAAIVGVPQRRLAVAQRAGVVGEIRPEGLDAIPAEPLPGFAVRREPDGPVEKEREQGEEEWREPPFAVSPERGAKAAESRRQKR
jgi:hypothetical protein